MAEIYFHQILSLLRKSHLVNADCSEKDFFNILYGETEERLKILKWLVSQFSENYKEDIDNMENGLAVRLSALHFTNSSNMLSFVQGSCPRQVQEQIYGNIFRALHFILLAKDHKDDLVKFTNLSQHKPRSFKPKKGKVFSKPFDLSKAKYNLEEAKKLTERLDTLLGKVPPKQEPETRTEQLCVTDVEVKSISTSLNHVFSTPVLMTSHHPVVNEYASAELGLAVDKLHNVLLPMQQEPNGDEFTRSTEIDSKKMLEDGKKITRDISDFVKNSNISKINLQMNP